MAKRSSAERPECSACDRCVPAEIAFLDTLEIQIFFLTLFVEATVLDTSQSSGPHTHQMRCQICLCSPTSSWLELVPRKPGDV